MLKRFLKDTNTEQTQNFTQEKKHKTAFPSLNQPTNASPLFDPTLYKVDSSLENQIAAFKTMFDSILAPTNEEASSPRGVTQWSPNTDEMDVDTANTENNSEPEDPELSNIVWLKLAFFSTRSEKNSPAAPLVQFSGAPFKPH